MGSVRSFAFVALAMSAAAVVAACEGDDPVHVETPAPPPDAGVDGATEASEASADAPTPPTYAWDLPPGFPVPLVPADNPMSAAKVALGRHLFYDKRLSRNGTQSCASCHEQSRAFTESLATSIGSTGERHPRNAMSLANAAYASTMTWSNPVLMTLESQTIVPIFGLRPVELGWNGGEEELLANLRAVPTYRELFAAAFPGEPDPVTLANLVRGITSFERTLISGRAPYDRFLVDGDPTAMNASAKRGLALFNSERLECFHCHSGFNLQDSVKFVGKSILETPFHNTALYNVDGKGAYPAPNVGVFEFTSQPSDMGKFRVVTLRNVAVTAPYMHDGSVATLDDAIDHYAAAGRTIPDGPNAGVGSASPLKSGFLKGFTLTSEERDDLKAFFDSLTDTAFLTDPRHSDPWTRSDGGGG